MFSKEIRLRIYKTAEGIPNLMRWIVALIGSGRPANKVFEDVRRGKGKVPERVFDSSFNLPQVGEDGRATLLALSLFKPSATTEALAKVAGFNDDEERLLKALDSLVKLDLIEGADKYDRYQIRGLTLSMAAARLPKSRYAAGIWQRFVTYFKQHALDALKKYDWTIPDNPDDPRIEKSNILRAMQVAPCLKDWDTVMHLYDITLGLIHSFGVWAEAIKLSEQYAEQKIRVTSHAHPIIIEIHHKNKNDVAVHYESLHKKLSDEKRWKRIVLSAVKYELGVFAYDAGDYTLARQRFEEAKKLKLDAKDNLGVAISCNNLGVAIAKEGEKAEEETKSYRRKAKLQFREALKFLDKFRNPKPEPRSVKVNDMREEALCTVGGSRAAKNQGMRFAKVINLNLEWLNGLQDTK